MKTRLLLSTMSLAAIATAVTLAQDVRPAPQFRFERLVSAPAGPARLAVDVPLLAGARNQPGRLLDDLRLYDATGREVPYLVIDPPANEGEWREGHIAAITPTKKTSGFEADFGELLTIDRVRLDGIPAPFMKRAHLEGSGDRTRWTVLIDQATVFDLPDRKLRQVELAFPAGAYRYVRITWDDTNSAMVPDPSSVAVRHFDRTPPPAPLRGGFPFERRASEPRVSRYHVQLPGPHLPIKALELVVGSGPVFRMARVTESQLATGRLVPVELGSAVVKRVQQGDLSADELRIPLLRPPSATEIDLMIEDGDNPPLDLKGVTADFGPQPWIYFESTGAPMTARYGDAALSRPVYDLEATREATHIESVPDAAWGDPRPLQPEATPAALNALLPTGGAPLDPSLFKYSRHLPDTDPGLIALQLDAAVLAHSAGPGAGFADLRVVDGGGRQVPYVLEVRHEPLEANIVLQQRETPSGISQRRAGEATTYYRLGLPYSNLPQGRLVVNTSARVFQRRVALYAERPADRDHRDPWLLLLSGAEWTHANREVAAPALEMIVPTIDATELVVAVAEGDNSRLPLTTARLLLPSHRIRFFRIDRSALTLLYGRSDLRPAIYDLTLLAPYVLSVTAREIGPLPEQTSPASGPSAAMNALMSPRVFWLVLLLAVGVLLVLLAKLIRQEPPVAG